MSFDLYFCWRAERVGEDALLRHMEALPNTNSSQSDDGHLRQFEYVGPATGVYCLFDLASEVEGDGQDGPSLPGGYVQSGLSVSINFLRPHFFALEIMPIVAGIADALDLTVYDPQAELMYERGTSPDVLVGSWISHNDSVTRGLAMKVDPIRKPYLPRDQALYWWCYMRDLERYQAEVGEDIFIPSLVFLRDGESRVLPTVIWPAEERGRHFWRSRLPLPQVFPRCELVMLVWGDPAREGLKKVTIPYPVVMDYLAALLEDIDGPVDGLRVLRPLRQGAAVAIFDALSALPSGDYCQIDPDGFIDVAMEDC